MNGLKLLTIFCAVAFFAACDSKPLLVSTIPLVSVNKTVQLADYADKIILLSFGYTHCPDVCPTTLMHVSQALDLLSNVESKSVQAIFISLDPKRDSAEKLAEYVAYFHNDLLGVTASEENLAALMHAFQIQSMALDDGEISHTSYLYVVNAQGKVLDMMGHQTAAKDVTLAIRSKLEILK